MIARFRSSAGTAINEISIKTLQFSFHSLSHQATFKSTLDFAVAFGKAMKEISTRNVRKKQTELGRNER